MTNKEKLLQDMARGVLECGAVSTKQKLIAQAALQTILKDHHIVPKALVEVLEDDYKPVVGDVITDSNMETYGIMNDYDSVLVPERHNGKRYFILNNDRKLIQRNGKPTFQRKEIIADE